MFFSLQLFSLVEEWPHLRELALCIQGDYIILESKYGQFQRIGGEPYEPQIYESSDADPPQGTPIVLSIVRC